MAEFNVNDQANPSLEKNEQTTKVQQKEMQSFINAEQVL